MIMAPEEAKVRVCKVASPTGYVRMDREVVPGWAGPKCIADGCMTYWRWANEQKSLGYCALAGKPEF